MDNIQQLIEQAKSIMTCPKCGRHYNDGEITFKGFMDHTYILQTKCANQHAAIVTTWITSYAPPTIDQAPKPLESDDILDLHAALQKFDGNFKALWSKER